MLDDTKHRSSWIARTCRNERKERGIRRNRRACFLWHRFNGSTYAARHIWNWLRCGREPGRTFMATRACHKESVSSKKTWKRRRTRRRAYFGNIFIHDTRHSYSLNIFPTKGQKFHSRWNKNHWECSNSWALRRSFIILQN